MTEANSDSATAAELPIGSVKEWNHRKPPLPLLDLRSLADYNTRHIVGSVHIPLGEVRRRSYELPPRQDAFAVLVPRSEEEEEEDESAALALIRQFFLCEDDDAGGGANKRRRRAQKPWKVPLVILAKDPINWEQAKEMGVLIEKGELAAKATQTRTDTINQQHDTTGTGTATVFKPLPRLWQPDSMVKEVLLPLLSKRLREQSDNSMVEEIWDLGAGAGRDVCFLAEELKAQLNPPKATNFCVVAMDQRYRSVTAAQQQAPSDGGTKEGQQQHQEECLLFWKRRGVEDVTRCVSVQWGNSNSQQEHEKWFQEETTKAGSNEGQQQNRRRRVLCLFMVRFWNKSLTEFLARSKLLEKGTMVAVSQFAKPSSGATWDFEHPKEKHVLEREELCKLFCAQSGWLILHDKIVQDSDHGRTLVNFVAMKE